MTQNTSTPLEGYCQTGNVPSPSNFADPINSGSNERSGIFQPGLQNFVVNNPLISFGSSAILSWTVSDADNVELTYLQNYKSTTLNSLLGTIPFSGTHEVHPDFTQSFTLKAYHSGNVLNQMQLEITVIPPVAAFMQECLTLNISANAAVNMAGQVFGLENLCASNVMMLARAMNTIYPLTKIHEAIPAYYLSRNFSWNVNINGKWITSALIEENHIYRK